MIQGMVFHQAARTASHPTRSNEEPRKPEASVLMLRVSRFAPVDQLKSVGKPKETRSVSEGFFKFSSKLRSR